MSEPLKSIAEQLSAEQKDFLSKEFGVTTDDMKEWDEDKWGEIYDALCDIELEELPDEGETSDRYRAATELVTMFGNEIAKEQGDYDEDLFEEELKQ